MLSPIAHAILRATGVETEPFDYDAIRRKREADRKADEAFLRRWNKSSGLW